MAEESVIDYASPSTPAQPAGDVVAKAAGYYRMTRFLMVLIFVGCGAWFGYDGFINYPRENAEIDALQRQLDQAEAAHDVSAKDEVLAKLRKHKTRHSETDILIQKVLLFALPPLGIALLVWSLYNSRGRFRLSGNTLEAPGHPPLTLDRIRQIDRELWEKKGIAFLSYYQPGQMKPAKIKLDDFVYERPGIDAIFNRVVEALNTAPVAPQPPAATAPVVVPTTPTPAVKPARPAATPSAPAARPAITPPRPGATRPPGTVRPPANRPPPPKA